MKNKYENNKFLKKITKLDKDDKKDQKLDDKDVPIVVYCAHSKCDASKKLIKHLINVGYTNVIEYKDGLKGWFGDDYIEVKRHSDSDSDLIVIQTVIQIVIQMR